MITRKRKSRKTHGAALELAEKRHSTVQKSASRRKRQVTRPNLCETVYKTSFNNEQINARRFLSSHTISDRQLIHMQGEEYVQAKDPKVKMNVQF